MEKIFSVSLPGDPDWYPGKDQRTKIHHNGKDLNFSWAKKLTLESLVGMEIVGNHPGTSGHSGQGKSVWRCLLNTWSIAGGQQCSSSLPHLPRGKYEDALL